MPSPTHPSTTHTSNPNPNPSTAGAPTWSDSPGSAAWWEAWAALAAHRDGIAGTRILDLFAADPHRLAAFAVEDGPLYLDCSKALASRATLDLLVALARAAGLPEAIPALFAGAPLNTSEGRAALHTALRHTAGVPSPAGPEIAAAVQGELKRLGTFAIAVRAGALRGHTGQPFTDVVHIGLGGSYLGPLLAVEALGELSPGGPRIHFLANVDPTAIDRTLQPLTPATTLFLVASKSFTTEETHRNARAARRWLTGRLGEAAFPAHFVALTAHPELALAQGYAAGQCFRFWDWVGGRFSVWSVVGLPIALAIGMDGFRAFLAGAHRMDRHFRERPLAANMPVLLALLGIWNRNFLGWPGYAVCPYDERLRRLPDYVQQLTMESNGKCWGRAGLPVPHATTSLIFGQLGILGQHAFFQALHQGTDVIPVDLLCTLRPGGPPPHPPGGKAKEGSGERAGDRTQGKAKAKERPKDKRADPRAPGDPPGPAPDDRHDLLVASCLAQAEALLRGGPHAAPEGAAPPAHRICPGNRPSHLLALERLTPEALGALLTLYEHKTFAEGWILGIDPFDQWGVELGKGIARGIEAEIRSGHPATDRDPSTAALLARYRGCRTRTPAK
jgi:glucose-6-phosphate isomerase